MLGYAFCGSFCTHARALRELRNLLASGYEIQPIFSETVRTTDTRFGTAAALCEEVEALCARRVISTVVDAEPLGPSMPLDALIISPCTGNTLAKLAAGITDSAVTMAAKAHMRCDRPMLIALATNDAMSQNLKNIGALLSRKSVYFAPMLQDDPEKKPHSLVARESLIKQSLIAMKKGEQIRPLFLEK